ncbi:hypothetical protein HBI24_111880 [Parastagonospora nodorum]|nr:hypothetical protein HBI72_130940 [Parastagonospora nodorum]KAH5583366.1 hypothetical protein HBI24_111880 [Parastagonospora nodorum]
MTVVLSFRNLASTAVIFHVPRSTDIHTELLKYKKYRINSANLAASCLEQEQVQQPSSSSKNSQHPITLEQTTVEHFVAYEKCIQKGEISLLSIRDDYGHLLACYWLGSLLHDWRFQDVVVSKILAMLRSKDGHQSQFVRLLTQTGVQLFIGQCGTKSGLFRMTVSAYARFASSHEIDVLALSKYPPDFLRHVLKDLALLRKTQHRDGMVPEEFAIADCSYHNHGFYGPCALRQNGGTPQDGA